VIPPHAPDRVVPRTARALIAVGAGFVLAGAPRAAVGQAAVTPLRHLDHVAWTGENGPPLDGAHLLRRSGDGYLWLGANDALLRFDGTRFAIIDSTASPALKSAVGGYFEPEVVDASGAVWIARPDGGLVEYRNGTFTVVHAPEPGVGALLRIDGQGRRWLFGGGSALHELRDGRAVAAHLPLGVPDTGMVDIVPDTGRGLWIGTRTAGLWHVVGDRGELVSSLDAKPRAEVRPFVQSKDGTLWADGAGVGGRVNRLVGKTWIPVALPGGLPAVARAIVEDSVGAVWIGTIGSGVLRWRDGALDRFSKDDGLSDASIEDLLPDAGGSLWIATSSGGLDRLRPTSFATLTRRDGLPFETPYRIVPDAVSGELWASGAGQPRLFSLRRRADGDGQVDSVIATPLALPTTARYELLAPARGGGVWIGPHPGGLMRYRDGEILRFGADAGFPRERLWFALETRDGSVWLGGVPTGFGVFRRGRYRSFSLPDGVGAAVRAPVEDSLGHVWVAGTRVPVIYEIDGDRVVRRIGKSDGLVDPITDLAIDRTGNLWGATYSGLVRISNGRVSRLLIPALMKTVRRGASLLTTQTELWISSNVGVARLSLAELNAMANGKTASAAVRAFHEADGLTTPRQIQFGLFPIVRSLDDRIWISTPSGLAVVDPRRSPVRPPGAQLHIESVIVGGHRVAMGATMMIPAKTDRVRIEFSAVNPVAPERTHLQYRLDGVDPGWIDAATPRAVTYTQLRPGQYAFHVRSWADGDVSDTQEQSMGFSVSPAWFETMWARASGVLVLVLAGAGLVFVAQRRRSLHATELLRSQFDATLAERTRIARELHDTLLQGFTGIVLQLEGLRQRLERSPEASAEVLSRILKVADTTLLEARHSVWDMRLSTAGRKDLPEALEEISRGMAQADSVQVRCAVNGARRALQPQVEAVVLQVGREALRNAMRHASARVVNVELTYSSDGLRLAVADDGVGLTPHDAEQAPAKGHFGIAGMRERAARAGGRLAITAKPGGGTTVELALPT
jgi:signal transduction histidine kinase